MRSRNLPPTLRANSQLNSADRAAPMCRYPVGDGAKRTRIIKSGVRSRESGASWKKRSSRLSLSPVSRLPTPFLSGGDDRIRTCEGLLTLNGLANRRLQPLGHISAKTKDNSKRRRWFVKKDQSAKRKGQEQLSGLCSLFCSLLLCSLPLPLSPLPITRL